MYQLTGSTLAVGLISLTHLVPLLTLTVIGGAIADAFDRRRVMLVQQVGMVAGSLGLAANAALSHPRVWPLYVFQFVISAAFSIGVGAQRSMTPQLVDESHFLAASALNSVTSQFGAVGGRSRARLVALGAFRARAPARAWCRGHCVAVGAGDRGLRLCATVLAGAAVAGAGRIGRSDQCRAALGHALPDHSQTGARPCLG